MKHQINILAVTLLTLGSVAIAEPARRAPKTVAPPQAAESDLNLVREEGDVELIGSVFLGISNDGQSGGLAGGFSGEFLFYRFLGIDAFAFHDLLQGSSNVLFSDTPTPGDKLQYGAYLSPKVRAPFSVGSVRVVPHVGAGLATRGGLNVKFNGATAVAGLELQFLQIGVLELEYMQGIAGRTKKLFLTDLGSEAAIDAPANTFNRFGIGFTIQVSPSVGFGARYIRSQIQSVNRSLTLLRATYRF